MGPDKTLQQFKVSFTTFSNFVSNLISNAIDTKNLSKRLIWIDRGLSQFINSYWVKINIFYERNTVKSAVSLQESTVRGAIEKRTLKYFSIECPVSIAPRTKDHAIIACSLQIFTVFL